MFMLHNQCRDRHEYIMNIHVVKTSVHGLSFGWALAVKQQSIYARDVVSSGCGCTVLLDVQLLFRCISCLCYSVIVHYTFFYSAMIIQIVIVN